MVFSTPDPFDLSPLPPFPFPSPPPVSSSLSFPLCRSHFPIPTPHFPSASFPLSPSPSRRGGSLRWGLGGLGGGSLWFAVWDRRTLVGSLEGLRGAGPRLGSPGKGFMRPIVPILPESCWHYWEGLGDPFGLDPFLPVNRSRASPGGGTCETLTLLDRRC